MERGQKLGVKYLFPWVLAPLRVGLASVSVVTGRELRGVLIADQLARASVVCRGAAPSRRRRSNDTRPPGGAEDRGQGVVLVVRKLEKSMAGRRQLIETMSHREPRGVCLHWAVSKNPNSLPLSLPLFFLGSSTKIMVWVVQYQNHGGWDWDTPFVVPPAAWDCLTLPSARLVLSRSISSVECRTDGSSPRCCSSCCSSDVGAAGVPVVIRPIPGPTTETTDTHVPASPYRRRMCYVCGTAWPRSMYRATRFPCAIPTTVEVMATSQKHYPPREGTGRKKHLARLPNVYLYPGRPRDSISTSTKEQVGIRLARFRHVRYGPPKQMQTLLPCAAAQRGCKIQLRGPSLVLFKTSNRQMALGIPSALWHAASSPRLPLEETNNKIPCGILGHPHGYVRGSLSVNRPDAMP